MGVSKQSPRFENLFFLLQIVIWSAKCTLLKGMLARRKESMVNGTELIHANFTVVDMRCNCTSYNWNICIFC